MSIKETLERFDEQFEYAQSMSNARGCFIIFCRKDNLPASTGQIKQFITEEIKLAMEKIVPKKYVSKAKFVDVILYGEPAGYNKAIKKINSNISKYFE